MTCIGSTFPVANVVNGPDDSDWFFIAVFIPATKRDRSKYTPVSLTHGRSEFCVGTGADVRSLRGDRYQGEILRRDGD